MIGVIGSVGGENIISYSPLNMAKSNELLSSTQLYSPISTVINSIGNPYNNLIKDIALLALLSSSKDDEDNSSLIKKLALLGVLYGALGNNFDIDLNFNNSTQSTESILNTAILPQTYNATAGIINSAPLGLFINTSA